MVGVIVVIYEKSKGTINIVSLLHYICVKTISFVKDVLYFCFLKFI